MPIFEDNSFSRKEAARTRAEIRAAQIRELPAAELEGFCTPSELISEIATRQHYERMNQPELEKQAEYDPYAAAELKRRRGELPR